MSFRLGFGLFIVLIIRMNGYSQPSHEVLSATLQQVLHAAELLGLHYTPEEAEQLAPRAAQGRNDYQSIRDKNLPNTLQPAFRFDPRPTGFTLPAEDAPPQWSHPTRTALPENHDDLAFYSIRDLAHLIQSRLISSVQLTEFFLHRLKHYNPQLHCVITLTEDLAIQQAKRADQEIASGNYRGLLHGIPYGAKDLLAVKGYPTTWGAAPYQNQRFHTDAAVIQKLEAAGAVLLAKLSLGELAMGDVWFNGKTRNPWNLEQGSSGSSAGSASAVAAGLLPFAIGSETYGSIVSPSYRCGVTGLRPTFGRVSRAGAMALSWTMDKLGPLCRTVEDCAIVFNAIQGADPLDPSSIDAPFPYSPRIDWKTLRIGYFADAIEGEWSNKTNDLETINQLKQLGAQLFPLQEPDVPISPLQLILHAEAAAAFDPLTLSNRDDELVQQHRYSWPNTFRSARLIPAVEYINANRIRSRLIESFHQIIQPVDIIVTPAFQGNALLITNLTGHPSIALPNGFNDNGEPAAITFIGHLYDEARLLAAAKAYQDSTGFHTQHPQPDKSIE